MSEMLHAPYIQDMRLFNRLDESARETVKNDVLGKILKSCARRYKFIDFTEFDKTKGDITKFKHYTLLSESVNVLFSNYGDVAEIELIHSMFVKLHEGKKVFRNAFASKNAVGVMMYNTMLISIFEGCSYIISAMVDVDAKSGGGIEMAINHMHTTKSNLLIKNLKHINTNYDDLILLVDQTSSSDEMLLTEASVIGLVKGALNLITLGFKIIPAIRELLFLYFFARVKISDAAKVQANFLEANAARLEDSGDEKVAEKQRKIASTFNKIAQVFALEHDDAENNADKEMNKEPISDEVEL